MMNWTDGHGWMGFGWIFMTLFWVLIIAGAIAILRWPGWSGNNNRDESRKKPLEILEERYARGEIEREEYERKRRDLENF